MGMTTSRLPFSYKHHSPLQPPPLPPSLPPSPLPRLRTTYLVTTSVLGALAALTIFTLCVFGVCVGVVEGIVSVGLVEESHE